jgi:hypothetical protein
LIGGFNPLAVVPPGSGAEQVGTDLGSTDDLHSTFILSDFYIYSTPLWEKVVREYRTDIEKKEETFYKMVRSVTDATATYARDELWDFELLRNHFI